MRFALALLTAVVVHAQWLGYPAPGVPRTRDGKVDLSARSPRAGGKPDLSGVWHVQATRMDEWVRLLGTDDPDALGVPGMELTTISRYARNLFFGLTPEEIPETPAAVEMRNKRLASGSRDNPSLHCLPQGIPLQGLLSEVEKIVQTPGLTLILYESDSTHRQIYTDGRPLPKDPQPSWLGYSVGKWDGDTFVVETIGFNDKSWLDLSGHGHSESLRVTERYRRPDFGHLDLDIKLEDPVMYTRPITFKVTKLFQPDSDILEFYCDENEKDRAHLGVK